VDEFEIISRYFVEPIGYSREHVLVGPGDDCAVAKVPDGFELCVSTDTLIEDVHFPKDAAGDVVVSRALGANLSDLAAMGAEPYGFTLALTLPSYSDSWLSSFSTRLNELVKHYKLPLLGGNLARGQLSVTINIMGLVPHGQALLRSGAGSGDDIYVTGHLGNAAGGLAIVKGEVDADCTELVESYFSPVPRILLGQQLRNVASAVIDISDGFAADLGHLCKASGCGARVSLESIPVSEALKDLFGSEIAQSMAVKGGDDYELCFTVPTRNADVIAQLIRDQEVLVSHVGKIRPELDVEIIDAKGVRISGQSGYVHF
jgi:thiamine-monophosphate kinase|tara:strand:+ start:1007 stop:1957 length:951 start_codon:yes stop_codon:yes gene_type:complete